jgi:ABC-type polysaccharide/polyol phosphate transport system ATPase subunit
VVRGARLAEPTEIRVAPAVEARAISKSFALPHERQTTLKEHFLHPLRKRTYEVNKALDDISFEVPQGEAFGIIGPNGSGKSTLLKIIAGIYQPDQGTVRIRGKLSPFIELGVGFNPQLNARDNVRMNATLLGLSRRELDAKFDSIIAFAELERHIDQRLKNYSSGMQLRLAFSIAIQVPFEILLLDEVLAVGDASFQQKCYAVLDEMREQRKTLVFVSHDLGSVARYCDRALLLRHGVPQALGPADEVVARYMREES